MRLDYVLQPGDIQLLSNFTMLHTRTQYEDHSVRLAALVLHNTYSRCAALVEPSCTQVRRLSCAGPSSQTALVASVGCAATA